MDHERVRYFEDEYDSSQEKHEFTLEGGSFLFGSGKEGEARVLTSKRPSISAPSQSRCGSVSAASDNQSHDDIREYDYSSKDVTDYISQMKQIIPDMNQNVAKRLIQKYQGEKDVVSRAIDEYFEGVVTDKAVVNSGIMDDINSSVPSGNKKRPQGFPISGRKRFKDVTEKVSKEDKNEIEWKRFIGSLQVNAMATRPTLRPLSYGSTLEILKSSNTLSASSLYGLNGRKKVSMACFTKIFDAQQNREIGRLPEDIAQIVYPLIDTNGVVFEATMVFCENKRLSIGDSFILQLDCFLTSSIFDDHGREDPTSPQSAKWMSPISMAETEEELRSRSRNAGLLSLFDKLRLKTVDDIKADGISVITVDSDDDGVEVIDLNEDEDEVQSPKCETHKKDDQGFSFQREDILNLNQLKMSYKGSQSSIDFLKDMPETEPPPNAISCSLRKYQRQGLTWMLRREHEFEKAANSDGFIKLDGNLMNPLWKCFKWPKDMSWKAQRIKNRENISASKLFYANLHTGEFCLEKPVLRTTMKGGILSDEMGLGKTISALSLIFTSPYDSSVVDRHLFMNNNEQKTSYFPSSQPAEKPYAPKTTLVIVPTSLLSQWHGEFRKFNSSPDLYCELYYGGNVSSLKSLLTKNKNPPVVVLTTYGIVQNEWTKMINTNRNDAIVDSNVGLFSLRFYRVILDEGHVIRNRTTSISKATMEISSKCRWVLTGTPIINRLDDLYSIVKFLKLEPWAQINYWKMFVSQPFERKDYKQAFDVVNAILDPVLLRRTKQMRDSDGKPLVELPPKEIIVEKLKFNEIQNGVYRHYLDEAETSVKKCLAGGDLLKKYSMILVHILRLRQICCDVRLLGEQDENDEDLTKSARVFNEPVDMKKVYEKIGFKPDTDRLNAVKSMIVDKYPTENSLKKLECSICTTDPIELHKILFTECCHCFCEDCLKEYLEFQKQRGMELKCPNCRQPININYLFTLNFKDEIAKFVPLYEEARSAKIDALLDHCDLLQKNSPGEQIVVFSQFSSFLDILEIEISSAFHGKEVKVYKFNGRLNLKERASVLEDFSKKDFENQKILLISLRTGGVGLNLTCASYAFIMDPWWSPSMEDQAIDRIHRIGQIRQVKVIRFIVESSIEEKMLKIQERKRTLGEVMDADEEERRRRRIDEIQMLFE